jgi:hypothetical protein
MVKVRSWVNLSTVFDLPSFCLLIISLSADICPRWTITQELYWLQSKVPTLTITSELYIRVKVHFLYVHVNPSLFVERL